VGYGFSPALRTRLINSLEAEFVEIKLDRKSPAPLYLQIRNQIRRLILSRRLQAGSRLPPERELAGALGVNRSTVVNAYRELEADGLIESYVGRGTTVKFIPPGEEGQETDLAVQTPVWKSFYSRQAARMFNPIISNILDLVNREDIISLAVGLPSNEFYPLKEFNSIMSGLICEKGRYVFGHGPTAGHYPLREYLAGFLKERGVETMPDNSMVLSGSQQGLDLAAKVFLEPGDALVVEEPSYMGALQVFAAAGARILGVPLDEEGLRVDILEQILSRYHPKFIYTLPTFQNPSGITMSILRRRELLKLAYRFHVPILEDDPYSELYYEGERMPSLKSMDNHGYVIYLSTFSKMLFPGLRLGWVAAPPVLAGQLVMTKQLDDFHVNSLSQWAVNEFCRRGLLEKHLMRVREEYAVKRDLMQASLEELAPPGFRWNRPAGGYHFWCKLPEGVKAGALLARTIEKKAAFVPSDAFFANGGGTNRLRLSFSRYPGELIREGVRRIFEALGEMFCPGEMSGEVLTRQEVRPLV